MDNETKKKKFVVPTIKEVEDYILEKKSEWPMLFIQFYAAKFWNHYEAAGWRLSSGNKIVSWTACFNSQWQEVKYDCVEVLRKFILQQAPEKKVVIEKRNGVFTVDYMNQMLNHYKKHHDIYKPDVLASYFDWMKDKGCLKLTQEEIQMIKDTCKDKVTARAACVTTSLQKMINYCISFK